MGDVIRLADRRRTGQRPPGDRRHRSRKQPALYFDLACPFSYLALERAERLLPGADWRPALVDPLTTSAASADLRAAAERRAAELRIPLVWPDPFPGWGRPAMRATAYAAEHGRGSAFALAASRLAFCGGFELDDPEVLTEAAAAAGIALRGCLEAARDASRDQPLEARGRWLWRAGADRLPAVVVDRTVISGEHRLAEAAASVRAPARRRRAGVS